MRAKLMTSAAVLAGALAFATMGQAQSLGGGGWGGSDGETEHSHNDNSHTTDSYNSHTTDSNNDNSTNTDNSSYTDNTQNIEDSFNDDSNVETEHSYNADASFNTENSFNTDNSTNDYSSNDTYDVRVSLNYQELYASVSDVGFDQTEEDDGGQHGHVTTGAISQSGGAFAGFAGIQTVSNNSGAASIGQAATAVSANANVTFGSGGGL